LIQESNLVRRSLNSVWHPCTQMQHHESTPLVAISRGEGTWLYGTNGERYLDAISSWWVNLFGHCNPRINASVREQLGKIEHVMLAGFTHQNVVELSERLSSMTDQVLGHTFYASDGSSAVEIALKMSFHFWKNAQLPTKREFVCLKGGYHGETIGALSVTDVPLFRSAYAELINVTHVISSPSELQSEADIKENGSLNSIQMAERAAKELQTLLDSRADYISAIILEPLVQCAGGMAMYDQHYLKKVRALCDKYGVHLIADEIAVGCGRTGTFFAFEQAGCWPDFICLSKGISGGYLPLSMVMCTNTVYSGFYDSRVSKAFLHSHSYTGNPLACSAAIATLNIFKEDQVILSNKALSAKISNALLPIKSHPLVKHFRNTGMIWAFEVATEDPVLRESFSRRFFAEALKHELLMRPIGQTVYLMPPYILSESEVSLIAERVQTVLHAVMQ
jgi:adenosylmethionine---8-amino-7-oxononanoate aminotransferase